MTEILAELGGVSSLSAVTILGLMFLAVMLGKIIPEKTHDRIVKAKDDEIGTLREVNSEYWSQTETMLTNDETILKLLRSIENSARSRDETT